MITIEEINRAVAILKAGGLVAFPTETVYGLGADACQEKAVQRVFDVKKRPYNHPLIVHLPSSTHLDQWAVDIPEAAWQLAQHFCPGPLTLLLKKHPRVLDCVTGGQPTIGLRVPSHPDALRLLQAFGGGVAAPSANQFTHVSPTTAKAVAEELGDQVDLILDGGACEVGLESTIIDMTSAIPTILRPGMITADAIAAVLGGDVRVSLPTTALTASTPLSSPAPSVPGSHALHYAPRTPVVLVPASRWDAYLQGLSVDELPAVCLGCQSKPLKRDQLTWVEMPTNAAAYAHQLYQVLRATDKQGYKKILIEAVPATPAWVAIQDRLLKASGSR